MRDGLNALLSWVGDFDGIVTSHHNVEEGAGLGSITMIIYNYTSEFSFNYNYNCFAF